MKPHALLVLLASALLSFADEAKETAPAGFRTFTGKNGKTLEAKVVARLDDETYTFATAEGKSLRMNISSLADSDQAYLMRWDPDFPVDLSTVKLEEAVQKMGYSVVKMEPSASGTVVIASIGDTELKLQFNPSSKISILSKAAATKAGLKTRKANTNLSLNGQQVAAEESSQTQLSFGGHIPENLRILVAELNNNADGILGKDLIQLLNAVVDFKEQQLFVK